VKRSGRWIGRAAVCLLALAGCGGSGTDTIAEVGWDDTPPATGRVIDGAVEISATDGGGAFPLTTIQDPDVGGTGYEIVGEVRYEGVAEPAYLEMWSVFPDGSRFFSRTLGTDGPMAAPEGDSGWRAFELPFFLEGVTSTPSRLELNAVLPSSGRIWIGPVRLVGLGGSASTAWWSDRSAGVAGAMAGVIVGIFGASIGMLASRGKARRFVLGTMTVLAGLGVVLLGAGAIAFASSQPYGVTGSLLLGGGLLVVVAGAMIPATRRVYAQAELRKMKALDAA
jgi:hypothetical protein